MFKQFYFEPTNLKQNSETVIPYERYKIYVDMDGVLCDFVKQYEKFFKKSHIEYRKQHGEQQHYENLVSGGKEFWSTMPWMVDGKQLWKYLNPYNPTILSQPITTQECIDGKIEWCQRELGEGVLTIN